MKNFRFYVSRIGIVILVIAAIVFVGWRVRLHYSKGITTYIDSNTSMSIDHPRYLKLTPVVTEEKALLFYLDAPERHGSFVGFIKDHEYAERDRNFYDGVLFKESGQTVNSRVSIGDYVGYKAVVDVNVYRYTLYRDVSASSSLIIRSEISASSSPQLASFERDFLSMVSSISVDK